MTIQAVPVSSVVDASVINPGFVIDMSYSIPVALPNGIFVYMLLDPSQVPPGETVDTVQALRNGIAVPNCVTVNTEPLLDPCVVRRQILPDGDIKITLMTSHLSTWALAFANPKLSGSVSFEGRGNSGDPRWGAPLHVTYLQPGTNLVVATATVATNNLGQFTLGPVTTGTYDVVVKHPLGLSRRANGLTFTAESTTQRAFGQLKTGDIDNNDLIDIVDFSNLRAVFGSATGCASATPIPNPCADLDANGLVDIVDFSLLRSNFGATGPLPG